MEISWFEDYSNTFPVDTSLDPLVVEGALGALCQMVNQSLEYLRRNNRANL